MTIPSLLTTPRSKAESRFSVLLQVASYGFTHSGTSKSPQVLTAIIPPTNIPTPVRMLMFPPIFSGANISVRKNLPNALSCASDEAAIPALPAPVGRRGTYAGPELGGAERRAIG